MQKIKLCYCGEVSCEGSSDNYCVKHCASLIHGHCTDVECEDDAHEGSVDCTKHCTLPGHGHCTEKGCEEVSYEGRVIIVQNIAAREAMDIARK